MEPLPNAAYNQAMTGSRHTNGLLAIVSLAVIGYLLFTLPPKVLEHYETAAKLGTWPAYLYLAAVGSGALVLFGLAVWALTRVWQNTRQKTAEVKRRNLSPSEMSSGERARELGENLAAGKDTPSAKAFRRSFAARSKPPSPNSKRSASRSGSRSSRSARSPAASRRS